MDISPVIASLQNVFATTSSQRVVFSLITPATTSSTSVDISGLGKLLSSASVLERSVTTGGTGNVGFPTVLATTQLFVDAFNAFLQGDSLQNASGASVGSQFVQTLNAAGGQLDRLSGIGIGYQPYSDQSSNGQLTIDVNALQAAFNADQNGTIALLAQATQSIGQSATQFTGQLVQMDILTQISNSQSSATVQQAAPTYGTNVATAAAATAIPAVSAPVTEGAGAVIASGTTQATGSAGIAETPFAAASTAEIPSAPAVANSPAQAAATAAAEAPGTLAVNLTTGEAAGATPVLTPTGTTAAQGASPIAPGESPIAQAALPVGVTASAPGATVQTIAVPPIALPVIAAAGAPVLAESVVAPAAAPVDTSAAATTATPSVPATPSAPATPSVPATPSTPSTAATATATTAVAPTATVPVPASAAVPVAQTVGRLAIPDASNPAIAAAIAAYHMVDGIFDTAWPHDEGITPAAMGYSDILPVAPTQPARLNLHA